MKTIGVICERCSQSYGLADDGWDVVACPSCKAEIVHPNINSDGPWGAGRDAGLSGERPLAVVVIGIYPNAEDRRDYIAGFRRGAALGGTA